jgi:crossover junction endodeoxyribonuclease RusA
MTTLELPWPPSVNHYWRFGNGHFHVSSEGRAYKLMVAGVIVRAGLRPLEDDVKMVIDAWPPDRRRRDLDNIEKCLLDSCAVRRGFTAGLYRDDCQIKRKVSTMHPFDPERAGRVQVTVSPWPEAESAGVPVPAPRPRPALPVAACPPPDFDPLQGAAPWLAIPGRRPSSPSATPIFPTTASRLWARLPR